MSDGSMSIGTFSRASFLSVKALRAYHEGGLLVPARVDPATGYRIYHASQLIDAAVIHRLRSLDLCPSDGWTSPPERNTRTIRRWPAF